MASNVPEDFDEQFLTCPVCMLHFRDPKILPCLHTFCRECLEEWASKQQPLECPTCRTQVSLPDQGVDGLRTNFYVNNLLDFAAAKKGAEPGVPCQVCEGNVEGSKSWCTDCAILMCESCTLLHSKFPTQKNHEVTTEETIKAEKDAGKFQRKRHCHKHQAQELAFYCESCNALVCTACTVVDHRPGKDHNPVELATVARQRKEELQGLLRDIDPRLREIEDSVKELEKEISKLMPSKEAATDQAKAYFRRLVDLLQKREKEILSRVDEQCRADGKALQTKKEAIEFELAGLTSAQTFCQQAVEHGSDVHVLEVGNQVKTRIETLLAKQLGLESDWSEFQFVENTAVVDFEKQVHDFGDVKTKVDALKCTVDVESTVLRPLCVAELTTMNKEGRSCVTDSKAVTTNMKDPSGKDVPTTQLQSGGKWKIFYFPRVIGNHRLEVKVNSQQVAGSPFDVIISRQTARTKRDVGKTSKSGFSFVSTGQSGFGFGTSQQRPETTKPKTGFSFGFALPQTSTTSHTTALTGFEFKPTQPETSASQSGGFSFKLDQSQPPQSGFGLKFGQSQPTTPSQSGFKFGVSQSQSSEGSQPATSTEGSKFTFGDVKDKATAEGYPDVIFLFEKKPTADQIERAKKYLLPPTFYLYEDKPLPEGWTEDDKLDDKPERRVAKGKDGETPSNASEAVSSKKSQSPNVVGTASSSLMFADLIAGKTQDFARRGKSDGFQGASSSSFGDMFKPKPESWDCPTCMVSSTGDKDACAACLTPKPGTSSKPSEPTMSFGDMFKSKPGPWDCRTCMVSNPGDKNACLACMTPKPGTAPKPPKSGFSFGAMFSQGAASQPTAPFGATGAAAKPGVGTASQSGFSFASTGKSGFGFGASQQTVETTRPKTGFSFGFSLPQTSTTTPTTALTCFQPKSLGGAKAKVDVSKCKVVLNPALQGLRCVAVLTTVNTEGRPCVTDSKAVTTNMKDPSEKNVPTQVHLKSAGAWEISQVPKIAGNYKLEVKVNSQQVTGSPFVVAVKGYPALTIGQKGSGVAELNLPLGVAVDKDGKIAVLERGNKRVQIFDAETGQSLSSFPVDGEGPHDVDVDSEGRILVTSSGETYGLRRYSKEGELLNTFMPDCMKNPRGLSVLKDGRMLVVDGTQKSCLLLQPDGSLIREIGKGQLQKPVFVSVDESRDVMFVTDKTAHNVFAFDFEGNQKFNFGKEGQNDGEFQEPNGITLDPAGNIIVGDSVGRVQVFGSDGIFIRTVATVKGNIVGGLALTLNGYLAVACWQGHCIELYRYM
ncbi:TRIM2 [Branchiostoma lanceolatum]|uniref:Nuclear pore complex protein Nup153 n=1 Tax=Branchiostoma lanceolatum TaxID=7740 RepID=A0A8J9YY25_BRALA|nr:TRIM2 [Branchiostoma lanceolatum]